VSLASAQEVNVAIPPGVKVEGVPPIPQQIADTLARYGDYRSARFVSWHPTKRQVLVSTRLESVPQLYAVEAPGRTPVAVTTAPEGVSTSIWAQYDPADPNTIVFVKDASAGKEAYNLYRYDVTSKEITLLTDGKSRYASPPLSHPIWARGGKWIAYDSTERNGKDRDLWVMQPSDPKTARRLGDFENIWLPLDFSPDGNYLLAINTIASGSDGKLWRIDVRSGERKALVDLTEPGNWDEARYSPDGKTIYALSDRGGVERLWKLAGDTTVWFAVTDDKHPATRFDLSSDGLMAAVVIDRGSTDELQVFDLATKKPRSTSAIPPGIINDLHWRPGTREVAFSFQNPRNPGDAYSLDTSMGTLTRWTTSPVGAFDPNTLPQPEVITWKGVDGTMLSGILYRPSVKFTGPRPVIVNFHGGPFGSFRPIFYGRSNYFLNELGIAIVNPNVRGSSGFGPAFAAADNGRGREAALKDVGTLLDWIAARPDLDKERVMLTGASYGGYMALEAGIMFNDRIRCVYEGAGQTNLVTFIEQNQPDRIADRRLEYGDERDPEMRKFLLSISPVTRAAELKKPIGIAHPGNDIRVPVSQAREMVEAVKKNGVPVWYMEYANVGHDGFPGTLQNYNFNFAAWIQFVKLYLVN
jgi:dipeptidyl aminopeptidase/acylaminoacyl peptidase